MLWCLLGSASTMFVRIALPGNIEIPGDTVGSGAIVVLPERSVRDRARFQHVDLAS